MTEDGIRFASCELICLKAADIRAGRRPHPWLWQVLAQLVGVAATGQ